MYEHQEYGSHDRVSETERQGRCLIAMQQAKAGSLLMEYTGEHSIQQLQAV